MARCSSDQCYSSASLCQTHECRILDRMMPVESSPAFVEKSRAFYSGQVLPGHALWVGTMIRASPHHREVGNRMITSRRNISTCGRWIMPKRTLPLKPASQTPNLVVPYQMSKMALPLQLCCLQNTSLSWIGSTFCIQISLADKPQLWCL